MRILVPVKRVVDANMQIRVKSDKTGVETNNVKMAINPFCEIALEEAVRLKEKNLATEVVAVTIGSLKSEDILRTSFAMGADRCILIATDEDVETLDIAKILKKVISYEKPGLVILGKQSIDNDNNHTAQILAGILGWSQVTFASKIDIDGNNMLASREVDGGVETVKVQLPSIVSTDLRLNEPRYASLPNIMKAKKRTIESATVEQMGVTLKKRIETISVEEPPSRTAGIVVSSAEELVDKLKNEAKVI